MRHVRLDWASLESFSSFLFLGHYQHDTLILIRNCDREGKVLSVHKIVSSSLTLSTLSRSHHPVVCGFLEKSPLLL